MSTNGCTVDCGNFNELTALRLQRGRLLARLERSAGAAPLDVLVKAVIEAEPIINDWIEGEGPNALDVARFIYARLSEGTDR